MAEAVTEVTTMSEALINTGIGMGTVFVVLILISFIIYLFKFIPKLMNREKKAETVTKPAAPAAPAAKAAAPAAKETAAPAAKETAAPDDRQLIAVIAAAAAAQMTEETGTPVAADGLVIRSIKKRILSN